MAGRSPAWRLTVPSADHSLRDHLEKLGDNKARVICCAINIDKVTSNLDAIFVFKLSGGYGPYRWEVEQDLELQKGMGVPGVLVPVERDDNAFDAFAKTATFTRRHGPPRGRPRKHSKPRRIC